MRNRPAHADRQHVEQVVDTRTPMQRPCQRYQQVEDGVKEDGNGQEETASRQGDRRLALPEQSRKPRTIRSAAPLSSMHLPITAASAITMPILPADSPNAVATRAIFVGQFALRPAG